jgi:hypothetical protein
MQQTATARPVLITAALLAGGSTTTVCNTGGAWALIHAPRRADYRQALDALRNRGEDLCRLQLSMSARYVSVQPQFCIRGNGYWYLRNVSNLGDTWPAGRAQYSTLQQCMDAALAWCQQAPDYREAVVYTRDLKEAGIGPALAEEAA